MNGELGAFSFVDRIAEIEPGKRARGRFAIPSGIDAFPASLATEAVGQLAALVAMAAVDFRHRPVAGLAGLVQILGEPEPGQILELGVELQQVASDAVAYDGLAEMRGRPLVRLRDCVGPMLPMPEFDDPQAVRERFALLCDGSVRPGRFAGSLALPLRVEAADPGRETRAILQVPASAPFFADHFPRRAVFPGTLLLDAMLRLAAGLAAGVEPGTAATRPVPVQLSGVKLRAFIPPGKPVELRAVLDAATDRAIRMKVSARLEQKPVAGATIVLGEATA